MNIESIFKLWDEDSKIDATQLQYESLKIPQLHNKYYKIYITERVKLKEKQAGSYHHVVSFSSKI